MTRVTLLLVVGLVACSQPVDPRQQVPGAPEWLAQVETGPTVEEPFIAVATRMNQVTPRHEPGSFSMACFGTAPDDLVLILEFPDIGGTMQALPLLADIAFDNGPVEQIPLVASGDVQLRHLVFASSEDKVSFADRMRSGGIMSVEIEPEEGAVCRFEVNVRNAGTALEFLDYGIRELLEDHQ